MALSALLRAATLASTWRATFFVAEVPVFAATTVFFRVLRGLPAKACLAEATAFNRLDMTATLFRVTLLRRHRRDHAFRQMRDEG